MLNALRGRGGPVDHSENFVLRNGDRSDNEECTDSERKMSIVYAGARKRAE